MTSASLKFSQAQAANLVEEPTGGTVDLNNMALKAWETKTILVKVEAPNE